MTNEEHTNLLLEVCLGDADAVNMLLRLGKIFRVWDNVWDGDGAVSKEDIDGAFSDLAFDLSLNEFYRKHRHIIDAQIFVAWNAWQDSNIWRSDVDPAKGVAAWVIRDYCNELVQLCAFLKGGKDHARSISLKVRTAYLGELVEGGLDGFIQLFNKK